MKCPGCDGRIIRPDVYGVGTCKRCGGLVTTRRIYRGDSYNYVLPILDDDPSIEGARYYDLQILGSDGPGRRHGWYRPETRKIVQIG